MSFSEKINALKSFFLAEEKTEDAKLGVEAKLVDGTIIRAEGDEFKEGEKLFFVTEEGVVPALEGMHETTEGMVIVTNAEGVITEVRMPEVKEELAEEAPKAEDAKLEEEAPEAEVEVEDEIAMRVQKLEEAVMQLAEMVEKCVALASNLKTENEKLEKEVEAAPVAPSKFQFKKTSTKAEKKADEKTEKKPINSIKEALRKERERIEGSKKK